MPNPVGAQSPYAGQGWWEELNRKMQQQRAMQDLMRQYSAGDARRNPWANSPPVGKATYGGGYAGPGMGTAVGGGAGDAGYMQLFQQLLGGR